MKESVLLKAMVDSSTFLSQIDLSGHPITFPVSFCSICPCQCWTVSSINLHLAGPRKPGFVGYGATAKIRKIEASRSGQKAHILALTGMSSLEDKRRAFEAGVDG